MAVEQGASWVTLAQKFAVAVMGILYFSVSLRLISKPFPAIESGFINH